MPAKKKAIESPRAERSCKLLELRGCASDSRRRKIDNGGPPIRSYLWKQSTRFLTDKSMVDAGPGEHAVLPRLFGHGACRRSGAARQASSSTRRSVLPTAQWDSPSHEPHTMPRRMVGRVWVRGPCHWAASRLCWSRWRAKLQQHRASLEPHEHGDTSRRHHSQAQDAAHLAGKPTMTVQTPAHGLRRIDGKLLQSDCIDGDGPRRMLRIFPSIFLARGVL